MQIYHVFDCEVCEFKTVTEEGLEQHMNTEHFCNCDFCDFTTNSFNKFLDHILEDHYFRCAICDLTLKTKNKLSTHICKVELRNPTFETFYVKNWYNANGCNSIYCGKQNQEIARFHSDKCWTILANIDRIFKS